MNSADLHNRFEAKYKRGEPDKCWIWEASTVNGFGQINSGLKPTKMIKAHIIAWILHHNKLIPKGNCVAHTCGDKSCVNPYHLYLTTKAEITKSNIGNRNSEKLFCIRGHPFDEENTHVDKRGHRHCRKCIAIRARNFYYKTHINKQKDAYEESLRKLDEKKHRKTNA